jgi:hypothetical protein
MVGAPSGGVRQAAQRTLDNFTRLCSMHNPKFGTHQQRSSSRARRAQWERDDGIPDREPLIDARQPFLLELAACGFHDLRVEPRLGYIAWRAVRIDTGECIRCCALKELLHWIADQIPRTLGSRNYSSHGYTARDELDAMNV